MKVKRLIQLLGNIDPEKIVIINKGNQQYSPLFDVDENAVYVAENSWSGAIGLERLSSELRAEGYDNSDLKDGESAVILHPIR